METRLSSPLSDRDVRTLRAGDLVFIDGLIFTGRIRFYERVVTEGMPPPIDVGKECNVQFHCSPAVRADENGEYFVSAVTGTASFRFASYLEPVLKKYGVRAIIGKGGMAAETYRDVFRKYGAVYLSTMGYGLGALYGRAITAVENVFWKEEFGIAQAMWILRVNALGPLIVDGDSDGNSLQQYEAGEIRKEFEELIAQFPDPTLKRAGERQDPMDEVIE